MRRTLVALALGTAVLVGISGCEGTNRDSIVRITATMPGLHNKLETYVADGHPDTGGRHAPLSSVAPLIPDALPASRSLTPCGARDHVSALFRLTITFASGRTTRYNGPCLPWKIAWLHLAVVNEAGQWSTASVAHTTIVGAHPAELHQVQLLLAKLGPTAIRQITFAPLDPRAALVPRRSEVAWKVVSGPSILGDWQAALLAHLYRSAAERLHLRPVGQLANSGGVEPVQDSIFGSRAVPLAAIRQVVAASGARIVDLHQTAGTIQITVKTSSPARFLKVDGTRFLAGLRDVRPGAVYFGVEDADGSTVYASGSLPDEGMSSSRPDLHYCGPLFDIGEIAREGPPCSA